MAASPPLRARSARVPLNPLGLFAALEGGPRFLLESVEGPQKSARYSFVGFDPLAEFRARGHRVEVTDARGRRSRHRSSDPYGELRGLLASSGRGDRNLPVPFAGGLVGYISYDAARGFERLPDRCLPDPGFPDLHFIVPGQLVCFDHVARRVLHLSRGAPARLPRPREPEGALRTSGLRASMDRPRFERAVNRALGHIRDGDIFQGVLSRRLAMRARGDPVNFYRVLRRINPSPYMFHLDFGDEQIVGSSPETLVRLRGGELTLRPIAGTRPRGGTAEEDERLKVELLLDEKERAEHLMLVDLGRNDLGRVSSYGSVEVDELMVVEKYSHVQHIVSNVHARLAPGSDGFDALKAGFPAGTVSGAPKIRAMELIEELEPVRRGPYAGGVGYFSFDGNMDFAITIRTMYLRKERAHLHAGAGIVADSVPSREFAETEQKLGAMVKALGEMK
ncbi:MAG: anthranilate synthase component I family protein [Halobacteria archaeon]